MRVGDNMVLHAPGEGGTLIDVLDRVLDKGIVIDGWARVSVGGIDLISLDTHVVVASIETYLRYSDALGLNPPYRLSTPHEGRSASR